MQSQLGKVVIISSLSSNKLTSSTNCDAQFSETAKAYRTVPTEEGDIPLLNNHPMNSAWGLQEKAIQMETSAKTS